MSTKDNSKEEKRIKTLTKSEQKLSQIYASEFYPGNDEIMIREFYNSHKDVPVSVGSFHKCRKNGIITNYDLKIYSQYFYNSMGCCLSAGVAGFLFYTFLTSTGVLKPKKMAFYLGLNVISGITIALMFNAFKYNKLHKELDIKYSAIWLKSIGKI